MPFDRVNDIDVYYESGGDGPRLLYIGGSGGDLRRGPRVLDGPLAEHFRLLAYDQRGLGQTTKPDATYTIQQYADDAEGLLDAIGWESCKVVGVSFGGMVAQELAIRHPRRTLRCERLESPRPMRPGSMTKVPSSQLGTFGIPGAACQGTASRSV